MLQCTVLFYLLCLIQNKSEKWQNKALNTAGNKHFCKRHSAVYKVMEVQLTIWPWKKRIKVTENCGTLYYPDKTQIHVQFFLSTKVYMGYKYGDFEY